jgi:hypothetical protein
MWLPFVSGQISSAALLATGVVVSHASRSSR